MGALAFALQFMAEVPKYVEAGAALVSVINHGIDKANQLDSEARGVTDADWEELNASIAAKRERLHG